MEIPALRRRQVIRWGLGIALVVLILLCIMSLGGRSGVTRAQVTEALPGDEIIADPWITIDRAATLPAPSATAWPWVIQLGKDRAGWYAPRWIENTLGKHAASTTLPEYQDLATGDIIPDWGGGSLKVLGIDPGSYVLYGSIRGDATTTYAFTWALVLEDSTASSSSFHLRLRLRKPEGSGWTKHIPPSLPGFMDYVFDAVMFDGLTERLRR